ncbi:hypothetical protein COOONC_15956 [Cooperia oncophora]
MEVIVESYERTISIDPMSVRMEVLVGKSVQFERIRNEPVVFIHGNGDAALHTQAPLATGWSRSIQYFLEQNYTEGELYATTWGDAWEKIKHTGSVLDSYSTMHTCSNLLFLRRSLCITITNL